MRKARLLNSAFFALLLVCFAWSAWANPTAPIANNGMKWRIGYVEGGAYRTYQWHLKALVLGLRQLDWVQIPDDFVRMAFPDEKSMWEWLGQNAQSEYLEFEQDAFWSGDWDETRRIANRGEIISRLNDKNDIDFIIAMGTWAGQDLANDNHSTAVIVLQSADPVLAGIVKSEKESVLPHIFAHCDPGRYKRQIKFFHSVTKFKKLGIAFEDTPAGRIYASVEDILETCRDLNVEVVECHTVTNTPNLSLSLESYRTCHESLAREVDAMYITNSASVSPKTLPKLLQPFIAAKIPTFAQMGFEAVRHGALLSSSLGDYKPIGMFYARTISQVLHGAKPNSLPQVFETPPFFALNMDTARAIGFTPSQGLLNIADVIQNER